MVDVMTIKKMLICLLMLAASRAQNVGELGEGETDTDSTSEPEEPVQITEGYPETEKTMEPFPTPGPLSVPTEEPTQGPVEPSGETNANGLPFVEAGTRKVPCMEYDECWYYSAPNEWRCNWDESIHQFINMGCHCDNKLKSCIQERSNNGHEEYSHCSPTDQMKC